MSFNKGIKFDVKPFKFGNLVPEEGNALGEEIETFELRSLKDAAAFKNQINEEVIKAERTHAREKSFSILETVREHRGLKDQEEREYRDTVESEVQARVKAAIEQAREEGYRAGHQEGYGKAYQEAMGRFEEKVDDFADILGNLKDQCHKVLSDNKNDAYKMVKNLTQWVTLKELEDEDYLSRLLEKLILEMNTKTNLVVRISQDSFKKMPEVVQKVEQRLGQLTNIRVEVDLDQDGPGIILESDNGIIDGSVKAQMASLDKLFESVGVDE